MSKPAKQEPDLQEGLRIFKSEYLAFTAALEADAPVFPGAAFYHLRAQVDQFTLLVGKYQVWFVGRMLKAEKRMGPAALRALVLDGVPDLAPALARFKKTIAEFDANIQATKKVTTGDFVAFCSAVEDLVRTAVDHLDRLRANAEITERMTTCEKSQ